MASSNIKLFDENKGNMLTDTEFNISTQRLNGLQTGVASSQLQNKAMYQASLVAYAIAQIMLQNGLNANDTDAVSAFVANLSGTMLQKVYDIATTAEAQAGVATGKWMSPALVKAAIDFALAHNVTFGGTVTLAIDPTEPFQAVTKRYVDNNFLRSRKVKDVSLSLTSAGGSQIKEFLHGIDKGNAIAVVISYKITYTVSSSGSSESYVYLRGYDNSSGSGSNYATVYSGSCLGSSAPAKKKYFDNNTDNLLEKYDYLKLATGTTISRASAQVAAYLVEVS